MYIKAFTGFNTLAERNRLYELIKNTIELCESVEQVEELQREYENQLNRFKALDVENECLGYDYYEALINFFKTKQKELEDVY